MSIRLHTYFLLRWIKIEFMLDILMHLNPSSVQNTKVLSQQNFQSLSSAWISLKVRTLKVDVSSTAASCHRPMS